MGQARRERGAVIERETGFPRTLLQTSLERVQVSPKLQDLLLLTRKRDAGRGHEPGHSQPHSLKTQKIIWQTI